MRLDALGLALVLACSSDGGDDSSSGSGDDEAGDQGTTDESGGADDGANDCPADHLHVYPGCSPPAGYEVPSEGCYKRCSGMEYPCPEGVCRPVWINPCVCPPGDNCCGSCGAEEQLCIR